MWCIPKDWVCPAYQADKDGSPDFLSAKQKVVDGDPCDDDYSNGAITDGGVHA
jgi:hypothetical protein